MVTTDKRRCKSGSLILFSVVKMLLYFLTLWALDLMNTLTLMLLDEEIAR